MKIAVNIYLFFNLHGAAADEEDVRQSDMTKDGIKKPTMALSAHTSKFSWSNNLTQVDVLAAPSQGKTRWVNLRCVIRGTSTMTQKMVLNVHRGVED